MLQIIYFSSFIAIIIGWICCVVHAIQKKKLLQVVLVCFIPFFVVRYILKQQQTTEIKIYAILVLGGTVIAIIAGILTTIYTVPV